MDVCYQRSSQHAGNEHKQFYPKCQNMPRLSVFRIKLNNQAKTSRRKTYNILKNPTPWKNELVIAFADSHFHHAYGNDIIHQCPVKIVPGPLPHPQSNKRPQCLHFLFSSLTCFLNTTINLTVSSVMVQSLSVQKILFKEFFRKLLLFCTC